MENKDAEWKYIKGVKWKSAFTDSKIWNTELPYGYGDNINTKWLA